MPSDAKQESYISFYQASRSASGATFIWQVHARDDDACLGEVRWFGMWRCYAFYPNTATVYERKCLRDIADFCETRTRDHMAMRRKEKSHV